MKKYIAILIILTSCQKEYSYERKCGTITDLGRSGNLNELVITIDNKDQVVITIIGINQYRIGDTYCK